MEAKITKQEGPLAEREKRSLPGISSASLLETPTTSKRNDRRDQQQYDTVTECATGSSSIGEQLRNTPVVIVAGSRNSGPSNDATQPTVSPMKGHTASLLIPSQSYQLRIGAANAADLFCGMQNSREEAEDMMAAPPPDTPCKKHRSSFTTHPSSASRAIRGRGSNRISPTVATPKPMRRLSNRATDPIDALRTGLSFQSGHLRKPDLRGALNFKSPARGRVVLGGGEDHSPAADWHAPPTPSKPGARRLANFSEPEFTSVANNALDPRWASTFCTPRTSRVLSDLGTSNDLQVADDGALPLGGTDPWSPQRVSDPQGNSRLRPRSTHTALPVTGRPTLSVARPCLVSSAGSATMPTEQQPFLSPRGSQQADSTSMSESAGYLCGYSGQTPLTPTASSSFPSSTSTPIASTVGRRQDIELDGSLYTRFDKVAPVGKGAFSVVYRATKLPYPGAIATANVPFQPVNDRNLPRSQVFAVKKSKHPYYGPKDRAMKLREIHILQALTQAQHVVHYVDHWEDSSHFYIQTEFYGGGNLEQFLKASGRSARLDAFRVFKVLHDLCLGLKEIHDAGFVHLDIKPANVLIDSDGALKVGDFGLAQPCSFTADLDIEGDRVYMAPEVLRGKAGQAADVFSLGLIALESSSNVVLPDNGPFWVALRRGDLSEIPSLTRMAATESRIQASKQATQSGDIWDGCWISTENLLSSRNGCGQQPQFMVDAGHRSSLDAIVKRMIAPKAAERPRAEQVLDFEGLIWVSTHRRAPAIVFEGN